jgi:hypothetical protein
MKVTSLGGVGIDQKISEIKNSIQYQADLSKQE